MLSRRLFSVIAVVALLATSLSFSTALARSNSAAAGWALPGPGVVLNEVAGATEPAVYLVQLRTPALARYRGELGGLAPTNPSALGQVRLDPNSAASRAYRQHLAGVQDRLISAIAQTAGRPVDVLYRFDAAVNAVAVRLTPAEARRVASLPGVQRVQRDFARRLLTDNGPAWIGAPSLWDGSQTGGLPGNQGEGVVIGVIDTGINPDHPSFADPGPVDGYNYPTRLTHYGVCAPLNPLLCNDKLIGMYDYTGTGPEDHNGHGSHTASTAGGNVLDAQMIAPTITINRRISGVAPHAHIISYKACETTPAFECLVTALTAAINQATLDQVDVINYSIGGGSTDPWGDLDAQAFLGAREAGVFVAASAGNEGPGAATVGSPADAPWVMAVGASTHDRKFTNALVGMSGGASAPPADIQGKSVTAGHGPAAIVYAGAPPYNNPLCNPFPAGTFSGQIVVCDRGTIGRVEKGQNVKNAGGGGMVLANDEPNGDSLIADSHALPAVHISYANGVVLKNWLASGSGHTATISGTVMDINNANGDHMASFSSRGPNPSVPDVLKPDVTAPGVDILAAFNTPIGSVGAPPEYGIISGTSMSSPHAAGAAALIRGLHPNWTPAEVQSALMTTAFTTLAGGGGGAAVHEVLKEDGATPADPFDMGAGRVDLTRAARAGLVLNETDPDYTNANPASGGDPTTLNLASLADGDCNGACVWTRTLRSTQASSVTWTASTQAPAGMGLTVTPGTITVNAGASKTIIIVADVTGLAPDQWYFAQVTLTPSNSAIPPARFPVAVYVTGDPGPDTRQVLHFHGNLEEGCTGNGSADLTVCDGPFLLDNPVLSSAPAASYYVPDPLFDCTIDRCEVDPNWIWNLSGPTTLEGPMTVEWWASSGGTTPIFDDQWTIRLWADGVLAFEQIVIATPDLPNVPALLQATVVLPNISATSSFVLHVDPVYIDSQANTHVYYDSTSACPGASGAGPCDSIVRMPVVTGGDPTPSPTNTPGPTNTPITPAPTNTPLPTNTPVPTNTPAPTNTPVPTDPPATGKTTGGGWLQSSEGLKINFGYEAHSTASGLSGSLQLNDKLTGVKIHLDTLTFFGAMGSACGSVPAGSAAVEFRGSGTFNGAAGASVRVCVQDNGEPGNSKVSSTPDLFYLECLSGCSYSTGGRTADDTLDGGNLQVHKDAGGPAFAARAPAASASSPSTLILNPVLLTEGAAGVAQVFTVTAFDQNQDRLPNATITLTRTSSDGSLITLSAVTDLTGQAVFNTLNLSQVSEYIATSGSAESNAVEVSPLLN